LLALHANGITDAALTIPAAIVLRLPLVVWVHDADIATRRVTRCAPAFRQMSHIVRWVAVSATTARELVGLGYAQPGRIAVIPNPIDPATTLARRRDHPGPLRVGFLGTPSVRKGFDLLPDVARGLDPRRARLLVFARPYHGASAQIERAWEELRGLAPARAEIHGRCDDVRDALARCDAVLCPSRGESFCRVAAEAMLNRLPVVGTTVSAVREIVGDDAGILVPAGRAQPIIDAVGRLGDDDVRRRMGEAGRRRAAAFAPDPVAREFARLYRGFPVSAGPG
jgi:glycosyltransferase involved in cell wall biosynthesis